MNFKKNTRKIFVSSFVLACLLMLSKAEAGFIKIINNSDSNIRTTVIPEPFTESFPYCWKCLSRCIQPNNKHVKEIVVPLDAFCGNEYFAIVGTEGGILFNGTCRNLSMLKNYEVSFFNTTFGVSCKSREI